jgi:hypothetical protein
MPFTIRLSRHFQAMAFVICLLSLSSLVGAESLWSGTWILRGPPQRDRLIMTIEEAGAGWKLTHQVVGPDASGSTSSTVLTPLDGMDVSVLVNGKPSGQTMGIRRIDSRHTVTVLKLQGKETGISKAELSSDGKVLTVVIDYAASNPIGKEIQYWDKQ